MANLTMMNVVYGMAGFGIVAYIVFLLFIMWGWITPSARWLVIMRFFCLALVLGAVCMRFYLSEYAIFYFAVTMVVVGCAIKIRSKLGV